MKRLFVLLAVAVACGPKATPPTTGPSHVDEVGQGKPTDKPADPADAPLPLWKAVRHGKLPNGLTYYVMPHGKPEKRGMLWLSVNAGSVQEDDDQRGLAHFVEHMCFNGTKRFPKAAIVNYVESIGVKFGPDLNAYTNFDETVYQLQVPTDNKEMISKGLDIVRDWAGDVSFEPDEVEKERGVVMEEWRLGRGFQQRLLDKLLEVVFGDSRYAKRNPIGLPEIIQKAPRDRLVKFYKDWYRPDLMAVYAVGDFPDAAAIEKELIAKFGDLKNPANERAHQAAGATPKSGQRISILTDKEMPLAVVGVGNMIPHRPAASATDFRRGLAEQLYQLMLNERLQSIGRRPDASFAAAGAIIQNITREVDAFARFAVVKGDDVEGALRSVFAEVLRVEKHGFTQSELDRARAVVTRIFEQGVTEFETRESRSIVEELVRNFLSGEEVSGPEEDKRMAVELLPKITLAEIGQATKAFAGADGRVIVIAGPEGKPMPTQQRVAAIVDEVGKSNIDAWKDVPVVTRLMEEPAWPGTVSKETTDAKLGTTEWTLANGMRVIVKSTDYEKDAVVIEGSSPGGLATASAKDFGNARFADEVAELGGVGELDADQLGKALAGKQVKVSTEIGDTTDVIEGSGSVKDLETLFQLIHLRMSKPRRDEQAFKVWQTNTADGLAKAEKNPDAMFARKNAAALWQNNARRMPPLPADVKAVDLDKALGFYRERFSNAGDFTFVIVGAVDLAKLKPLVEAYLGSLPGTAKKEKELDAGMRRVGGVVKQTWNLGLDQDKASVQLVFHGDEPWSRDKDRDIHILGDVLEIRLFEKLREEMSSVYGVGAGGYLIRSPRPERVFSIRFGCAPAAVDKLIAATFEEIGKIAKSGIGDDYLQKVKAQFLRDRETGMRTNRWWTEQLGRSARYGDDPSFLLDPSGVVARITSANVKAAAAKFLDGKRVYQAVLLPEKK